jgi:hypothetical protein
VGFGTLKTEGETMVAEPKADGGRKTVKQPLGLLERIIRSPTSAEMVGVMVTSGINIPEEAYERTPLRLLLARSIRLPLDDGQRNLVTMFVLHWLDTSDPAKPKVRVEAKDATAVKPMVIQLIQDLGDNNSQTAQRASASLKKQEAERKLDEMIGKVPGRPDTDANPILNTLLSGSAGNGNDLISSMLIVNELSENIPLPIRLGPRRSQPIEERVAWAENFARKVLIGVTIVGLIAIIGLSRVSHWVPATLIVLGAIAGIIWLFYKIVSTSGGYLFRKAFPQFDEEGFRKKAMKQCETTLAFLGITTEEVKAYGLEHKFLQEVDGELRKEGLVYNRYDEQIDDWVKDYLGLASARPTSPSISLIGRFFEFLNRNGW